MKKQKTQADIDWENRILCKDGNCIGVIGTHGRCKECGLPYDGKIEFAIKNKPEPENDLNTDHKIEIEDDQQDQEQRLDQITNTEIDTDWESRILCSDGNCIGVIGPDGHCKECGKPFIKDR